MYAEPETVVAYLKDGRFPDGAVIVDEIRSVRTQEMTTGTAHSAGDPAAWFVMVKDAEVRFPTNPNWGEGWG